MDTEQLLADTRKDFEQFAYVVSHDLQEQVRNITNYTGLIGKELPANEELQLYLSVVTSSAAKLNEQLSELLTYSRIGRNKQMEKVAIQPIVDELTPGGAVGMPEVIGHAEELKLLLKNLIDNAQKFHGDRAPEITVNCINKSTYWEFSITDNGIGIAENQLEKIFGMFQRLNPEEDYPGNGAGLAICKKIISWHNGKIWAESTPGQGSTFYFTLPL